MMCSMRFLVLIAIMLVGQVVQAAQTDDVFRCQGDKPQGVCLGTRIKDVKKRVDYWVISARGVTGGFSCDPKRKEYAGGFHNVCCKKELDLKKFTKVSFYPTCMFTILNFHHLESKLMKG
ncbi:uncharacterized protein PGTG_01243 [Puccinia graminis f. sp. tritici CRL 75-36-700-3]|uniref:Secreted protein n=1 Tax=Puccinia graminis f. sp. tritici (strain CRL 75-36-700-3 / race SCCL) TaxID=418459 RepID=E3JV37_PUCGT|nr:uncharacterized protein PGTG_01243 [Puccinia graminis f. sp. tritici CRL 75-36-700-3]EFP75912.2 hypothetical protein PGTG_01243 [Puccinia graminis f. sp. tritici CRL 75-36-700-3]